MKKLEVQIMGQNYLLGCPENGDARMLEAVNRVDVAMCKIRDAGKVKARDRIAVLAALNLAFELPEQGTTSAYLSTSLAEAGQITAADKLQENHSAAYELQLAVLLKRLDHALGTDGQLL
ncbi:Cell division protein ZapA [Polaromonas vacuolata]|uniref:Cell division protein ZapA n=1 Tax=Polaromonas vacuolata TaxID=37448 RepID=A0A6H2H801_9BURK|nr:cell division protein ZapA [Polaromonas vacuolata]QJC56012.1 Cell division protein ZapA [Polaromonas vacuolata]